MNSQIKIKNVHSYYLLYSIICKSDTNETQNLNGRGMCLVNYCESMPPFQDICNFGWQHTYYSKFLTKYSGSLFQNVTVNLQSNT